MNLCCSCNQDFGSLSAFDAHRVGTHEYTYSQGAKMDPVRDDGRRCLSLLELNSNTNRDGSRVFTTNNRGRWSLTKQIKENYDH